MKREANPALRRTWRRRIPRLAGLTGGVLAAAAVVSSALAQARLEHPEADAGRIEADVRFLAADEREGRGLGTAGLDQALRMVAERFAAIGLAPAYPERSSPEDPLAGYFQRFTPAGFPATANVIGILPGRVTTAPRALVVGAHVDHLGVEAEGAAGGEPASRDRIHNGADDNASGVAALLEIARLLAAQPARENERTVVFAVFSAEEEGLLGSRHFAADPIVPLAETMAMVNLDSVGRLRNRQLILFGGATAREFPDLLAGLNQRFAFDLVMPRGDAGASDQASFHAGGVPAVQLFTGTHDDYNRVTDEADGIDYAGLAEVASFTAEFVRSLRYRLRPLTFVAGETRESERVARMAREGERRVSLGFMPDFAQQTGGVKVGMVTPGGPAEAAGLRAGDVIVGLDGQPVETLVDYTATLREHAPGDRVLVSIRRGAETIQLAATVQERR